MKKEKLFYILYIFLCILPLIIVGISLRFLPDQIPMHYNGAGEITSYGSKYEEFIVAAVYSVFGFLMLGYVLREKKKRGGKETKKDSNQFVLMFVCTMVMIIFNVSNIIFIMKALPDIEFKIPFPKVVAICLGIVQIAIGLVLPHVRKNNIVGLRTKWSMKNAVSWKVSQKYAALVCLIIGAIITIASIVISEQHAIMFMILMIIVEIICCYIFSYNAYIKSPEDNDSCY